MRIEEPFRLLYSFGSEYVPDHVDGRVVLQIFGDGRVLLDNVHGGAWTTSWEGTCQRATLERILGHLAEAGFPVVPLHSIPPGATLRQVAVESGTREIESFPVEWWAATEMKGYAEAFRLLDSIVAELSQGGLSIPPASEPGLVRRAEQPIRPAVTPDEAWQLGFAPALVGLAFLAVDRAERGRARAGAEGVRRTVEELLAKYGHPVPAAPTDAEEADRWMDEVHDAAEDMLGGLAAEAFAVGCAVGQIRLGLEEETPRRLHEGIGLLQLSRHEPARRVAELATTPRSDRRAALDALAQSVRAALR